MRTNTKRASLVTHEGAPAPHVSVLAQLRRSVLSCLLWESEFYEDGEEIGKRIADLTAKCTPEDVVALAIVTGASKFVAVGRFENRGGQRAR